MSDLKHVQQRVWINIISEPNTRQVTRTYNNGQQFGLFINHDISILEIIMAKSYTLAFLWEFILQRGDLLLHAIQAELFGFIRGVQALGSFEPVPSGNKALLQSVLHFDDQFCFTICYTRTTV